MPNKKSATKRMRQNVKRAERNKSAKNKLKTVVKSALNAIESNNPEEIKASLPAAIKTIAKTAQKGVIHKGTAARKQSRLMKKANTAAKAAQKESK